MLCETVMTMKNAASTGNMLLNAFAEGEGK